MERNQTNPSFVTVALWFAFLAIECPSVLLETRHQTVLSAAESILRLVCVSNLVLSGLVCSATVDPVC